MLLDDDEEAFDVFDEDDEPAVVFSQRAYVTVAASHDSRAIQEHRTETEGTMHTTAKYSTGSTGAKQTHMGLDTTQMQFAQTNDASAGCVIAHPHRDRLAQEEIEVCTPQSSSF